MPKRNKADIAELPNTIEPDELVAAEASEKRLTDRPNTLPLGTIFVCDKVFQWRVKDRNIVADEDHTRELIDALEDHGKPLDPILVTAVGQRFFVVDGHHRLQAYHSVGWKQHVPVEHFTGDLKAAREEGLKLNSKNKLPMTQEDKRDAAWKLVKEDRRYSKRDICDLTTVSDGTVGTMRRIWSAHRDKLEDVPWSKAKGLQWGDTLEYKPDDNWREKKADDLARALTKRAGPEFTRDSDILAMALERLNAKLPVVLVGHWEGVVRDLWNVVDDPSDGPDI